MKISWATSQELDSEYLEVQMNNELGILVVQDQKDALPVLVFCSLFSDPEKVFYEGLGKTSAGISLKEIRDALDAIEKKLQDRSFP